MAHTYVITSVVTLGDNLTVQGSVDGIAVTVGTYVSTAGNSMASALAFRNFIAPLMLAALPPTSTANPALQQTFTQ